MNHYSPVKSYYGKSIVAHLPRLDKAEPFPCKEISGPRAFPVRADEVESLRHRYLEKAMWWDSTIDKYRHTDNYLAATMEENDQTGLRSRLASRATLTFAAITARSGGQL